MHLTPKKEATRPASKILSGQKCYLCLRNNLSPMPPVRTKL
jgi:hypothetical protein